MVVAQFIYCKGKDVGCFVLYYVCGGAPILVLRDWPGIWRGVTVEQQNTRDE